MAPKLQASALQAEDEEEKKIDSFPLTWILPIIFNVLFIICLFVALIYCLKRRKKKVSDQTEEAKLSPIFRRRTISQPFEAANFQFSTPSYTGSLCTDSSSTSRKSRKNCISSVDKIGKMQTKTQIESDRPISPVRYKSPGLPKPLSSVFTVQQNSVNFENLTNGNDYNKTSDQLASDHSISQLNISPGETSLSSKNQPTMQAHFNSEINDSQIKVKEIESEKLYNANSNNKEENLKQTINNEIESLNSTEVIDDRNDSIESLTSSDELSPSGAKNRDKNNNQEKDELIEQLSLQIIKEQTNKQNQLIDSNLQKLNNPETESINVSDLNLGDSQANLLNDTRDNYTANNQISSLNNMKISAANQESNKTNVKNMINKQSLKLDSFSTVNKTPANKDSPTIPLSSVNEISFNEINKSDKQNESETVDRQLHGLQNNSRVISRHNSKKSLNGSANKRSKRMKSAGIQTTPSLRRSTPQPRPIQNKESTFSNIYADIVNKLDPSERAEHQAVMQPIEEENFFYDPETEQQERKYFIYLISDTSNPYYKKDCIGKIMLPARGQITLSELRDQLFKQSEDNVKTILKKGKNFRFLTETYRFVSQNESIASVKEVYPTQGIFLKLNSSDNPVSYGRQKNTKNDLTNLINTVMNDSQSAAGSKSPHSGINLGAGKLKQTNLKAFNKDPINSNRDAATIREVPRVYRSEQDSGQSSSPVIPPFLSPNYNVSSLVTAKSDQRSAELREKLLKRHGKCLFTQPLISNTLPKQTIVKGELTKKCQLNGCPLIATVKCIKCGRAYYCSIEHKRKNWFEHKALCKKPPWRW